MGTREPATQVQCVWGCALALFHQLCPHRWICPEGGRQENCGRASDPDAPWSPSNPSNEGAAGDMNCYVTLWYPFSALGLDLLSPRKANVQEQPFHLSHSLLCWQQAVAMSTRPSSRGAPPGLRQEMMGYFIRSCLQLFITLTNDLITCTDFFLC